MSIPNEVVARFRSTEGSKEIEVEKCLVERQADKHLAALLVSGQAAQRGMKRSFRFPEGALEFGRCKFAGLGRAR